MAERPELLGLASEIVSRASGTMPLLPYSYQG